MAVLLTIGFMIVIWRLDRIARTSERLRDWYKIPNRQVYCQSFRIWLQNVVRIHIRNRIRRPAIPSLLILLLVTFIACGASCPNAQRNAYTTIYSVEQTASAAYDGYVDQVIAGKAATNDLPVVSQRFNQIQIAARIAATASQAGTNGLAPTVLVKEVTDFAAFIATLKNQPKLQ